MTKQISINVLPSFKRNGFLKLDEEIYLYKEESRQNMIAIRAVDRLGNIIGYVAEKDDFLIAEKKDFENLYNLLGNKAAAKVTYDFDDIILCQVTSADLWEPSSVRFIVKKNTKIFPTDPFMESEKLHLFKSENFATNEKRIDLVHEEYGDCGHVSLFGLNTILSLDALFEIVDGNTKVELSEYICAGAVFHTLKNKQRPDKLAMRFTVDATNEYCDYEFIDIGTRLQLMVDTTQICFEPSILTCYGDMDVGYISEGERDGKYLPNYALYDILGETDFAVVECIDDDKLYCRLLDISEYESAEYECLNKNIKEKEDKDMLLYNAFNSKKIHDTLNTDNYPTLDLNKETPKFVGVSAGHFTVETPEDLYGADNVSGDVDIWEDEDDYEEDMAFSACEDDIFDEDYDEDKAFCDYENEDIDEDYDDNFCLVDVALLEKEARENFKAIIKKYGIVLNEDIDTLPVYKLRNILNSRLNTIGYRLP